MMHIGLLSSKLPWKKPVEVLPFCPVKSPWKKIYKKPLDLFKVFFLSLYHLVNHDESLLFFKVHFFQASLWVANPRLPPRLVSLFAQNTPPLNPIGFWRWIPAFNGLRLPPPSADPLMGIEKAVKAMAASAGTTHRPVPEKNFDEPVPDKNPGGPVPDKSPGGPVRVTVTNLNGETLLEQVGSVVKWGNGWQLASFQFFIQQKPWTLKPTWISRDGIRKLVIQRLGSVVFFSRNTQFISRLQSIC